MKQEMKMNQIRNADQLRDFITTPSTKLVEFMKTLKGDIAVFGVGGKMGSELIEMMLRADKPAGKKRKLIAVSTFSKPEVLEKLNSLGVHTFKGDLSDENFLSSLPEVPDCIYMAGFKFGSSQDYRKAFHMNVIMSYLVGRKFRSSRMVVFSSANPYPHTQPGDGGCKEEDKLDPQGIYGWTIVGREESFKTAVDRGNLCFIRLAYAQHLAYGVLVDLAMMVRDNKEISLVMPYVNLISQRDANDVAIRALSICSSPPTVLNISGPIVSVREIVEKLAKIMNRKVKLVDDEDEKAVLVNDEFCQRTFGPYRDSVDEMISSVANWIAGGGEIWNIPTGFGSVEHKY